MEAFSILKKQQWLVLICILVGYTKFLETAVSEHQTSTSPIPFEENMKKPHPDPQNLQLAYADDHIALFYETAEGEIISQLVFTPAVESDTWKFKDKISYISSPTGKRSPTIYVVKHQLKSNTNNQHQKLNSSLTANSSSVHNTSSIVSTNSTDPNFQDKYIASQNSKFQKEVEAVEHFITHTYKEEIHCVLQWNIVDILVYDNLTQMENTRTAQVFLEETINKTTDMNRGFMFFEWYMPIYAKHGGSTSVTNFMNLLNSYSNQNKSNFYLGRETLNIGEFVHIWSEATATDLRYLVDRSSRWRWSSKSSNSFEIAQKRFMTYYYSDTFQILTWTKPPQFWKKKWYDHTSNLTLRQYDEHVAYYNDETKLPIDDKWRHQFLYNSWRYAKNTFSVLDSNSILHIIFDAETASLCGNRYFAKTFDYRFIIECPRKPPNDFFWYRKIYGWDSIMSAIAYNIVLEMLRVGNLSTALTQKISFSNTNVFVDTFVYDIYIGIGMNAEARQWFDRIEHKTYNYPRWGTSLYREWFNPIYITFNHTKAFQRFLALFVFNWQQEGRTEREMNAGEFVHFWSGAVGQDLTSLAMEGLSWTTKYNNELLQARKDYPKINYLYTTLNSRTSQWWNSEWKNIVYDRATNLVYSDDQIVCYFGPKINASISWPFKLMSKSWKYAKEQYGPFSPDPILNVILHKETSTCRASKTGSFNNREFDNRNVINCGKESGNDNAWNFDSFENKNVLLEQLGSFILCNARETLVKWPQFGGLRWSMVPILVYDIYKGIGMTEYAQRWRENMFEKTEAIPLENSFWLRDWYYPIYQKYGEALALNRFLSIVYANWETEDWETVRKYNLGEMVHFWSSAVGENLWPLADKAFGCCEWDQKTYLTARKEFLNLNYTDKFENSTVMIPSKKWIDIERKTNQGLYLVHVDQHLAVYFDPIVNLDIVWLFKSISRAWRYAKKTYRSIDPGTILYLSILSTNNYVCKNSGRLSYRAKNTENRIVITCEGFVEALKPKDRSKILHVLGEIVLKETQQTETWPAYFVSENNMAKIISYDILQEIGNPLQAITTLKEEIHNYIHTSDKTTFWLRDWFYPIYANYGKANVLNNFLNLLLKRWPKAPKGSTYDYVEYLNVGEFVHFWSGAAGENLMYLANNTFQWNNKYNNQLEEAQKSFPMLTYNNAKHIAESNSAEIVLTEYQFGHSELLVRAYSSSFVSIYFDADVNRAIEWPIDLISQTWAQTKSSYDTVRDALDPSLIIILHGMKHNGCKASFKLLNNTELRNTLDCGKDPINSDAWMKTNSENRLDLTFGFAKLIQRSAQQTEEKESYDPILFPKFLAFDIFLRLGNFKDAHRLLQEFYDENEIESRRKQFSIPSWYLPLYTKYGGVNILNNFVLLLSTTWAQQEALDANQIMNVGQTIHFWSASAGENLNSFAQGIFSKNQLHQVQFSQAIKEFPLLCYSRYDCALEVIGTQKTENQTLIIGVLVFAGVAFIVVAAILFPLVKYRKKLRRLQQEMRELSAEEIKEFFEGTLEADCEVGHICIESKPFNVDYEIPRDRLDIDFDSALGSGEFGLVYRGFLKPSSQQSNELTGTVVAVKTVKPNVSVTHFKTILTELKVMGYLGSHANIVSLLGAYTVNIKNREVYMALEFCGQGDLLSFLKLNRTHFEDWIAKIAESTEIKSRLKAATSISVTEPATAVACNIKFCQQVDQDVEIATDFIKNDELQTKTRNLGLNLPSNAFSTFELLKWSSEIASGMKFIACKNVIHGDLAARNVLLTEQNVAKISDFGLSRQLENYAFYMKTSKTPVPWRWMAIESLRDMKFSVQSDAWSFGVVLYEIFSLGTIPYAGSAWDCEFIDKLVAGHRLSAPEFGNEDIYKLMIDCMQKEASERVTLSQVISRLEEIKVRICQEREFLTTSEYLKLTS